MEAEGPLLHTVVGAGQQLNLGRSTIYELMKAGKLKSVLVNGSRRIPDSALREFVDQLVSAGDAA